jgi:hypothetical protein
MTSCPIDWNISPTFMISLSADFPVHLDISFFIWSKKKKSENTMSGYRGCAIHRALMHPRMSLDGFELWAGALSKCTSISLRLFHHSYVNTFFSKSRATDSMKNRELHVTLFGIIRRSVISWVFQIVNKGTFNLNRLADNFWSLFSWFTFVIWMKVLEKELDLIVGKDILKRIPVDSLQDRAKLLGKYHTFMLLRLVQEVGISLWWGLLRLNSSRKMRKHIVLPIPSFT